MKKVFKYIILPVLALLAILAINLFAFNINVTRISEGMAVDPSVSKDTALLVIDIQEATTGRVSVNESFKGQADSLISRVNYLAARASDRDWLVVYIRMEIVNPLINILNNSMAKGSEGVELDQRLVLQSDHIISKRKQDAFYDTDLDDLLGRNEVGHLIFTGLDAKGCVNSTIQAAMNRQYMISVVTDAVISDPDTARIAMFREFKEAGAKLIRTGDLWGK